MTQLRNVSEVARKYTWEDNKIINQLLYSDCHYFIEHIYLKKLAKQN